MPAFLFLRALLLQLLNVLLGAARLVAVRLDRALAVRRQLVVPLALALLLLLHLLVLDALGLVAAVVVV